MTEYRWSIVELERETSDGGVIVAHWRANAFQDTHQVSVYGSVSFVPNPDDADFIPYEELTEGIVIGWVKSALGAEVDSIESGLQNQLDQIINPSVVAGLPWVQEPVLEVVDNTEVTIPPLITPETLP